jgi:hypothetical protein
MQFQCDACGKRYSTSQEIREGRAYRFKCRACAHEVIVRGPPPPAAPPAPRKNGNGVVQPSAFPAVRAAPTPTPAPHVATSVVLPGDLAPPEGGYVEFRLDDDVVTHTTISAALPVEPARDAAAAAPASEEAFASAAEALGEAVVPPAAIVRYRPPEPPPAAGRRDRRMVVAVVAASAVVGVVAASVFSLGSGDAPKDQAQAVSRSSPGVLTPTVYVGPVGFEESTPQLEPSPAAPSTRPVASREPAATRRTGRETAPRSAAREAASAPRAPGREALAAPPPAPVPTPAPTPDQGPAEAQAAAPPPPTPPPAEPAPAAAAVPAAGLPAPPPPAPEPAAGNEEPVFAREGFRRPVPQTPRCIERSIRLTPNLADRLPSSVTMRFAVARDGTADLVQVLPGPDMRPTERVDSGVADVLRAAVRGCRFVPGADDAGRTLRLWVVMQVRFAP